MTRKSTAGKVLSELARKGLQPRDDQQEVRNGVPLLPAGEGKGPVTLEAVNRLLDED